MLRIFKLVLGTRQTSELLVDDDGWVADVAYDLDIRAE